MKLSYQESIELQYLYLNGYKYLSKNENGTSTVHKEKPNWFKRGTSYGHWDVEIPVRNHTLDRKTSLGEYAELKFTDTPLLIQELIAESLIQQESNTHMEEPIHETNN